VRGFKPTPVPVPIGLLPRASGRLKVVVLSPIPNDVPIIANNCEYVERLTADPSHRSQEVDTLGRLDQTISPILKVVFEAKALERAIECMSLVYFIAAS
jgi:hypothetical protein